MRFGDEGGTILEEKTFKGPIQQQIKDALKYINNNVLSESVRKIKGKDTSERFYNYPFIAIREALVNAFYHQDYAEDSFITIGINLDNIEIVSYPGPLLPIDKSNINNPPPARKYRNRRIGDLLKELKLAEERGTGYKTIKAALMNNGSPEPEFETDENRNYYLARIRIHPDAPITTRLKDSLFISDSINVEIEAAAIAAAAAAAMAAADPLLAARTASALAAKAAALSEIRLESRILNAVLAEPLNGKQIAEILNIPHRSGNISKTLRQMLKDSLIELTIPDKTTSPKQKYKITKKGKTHLKDNSN